MGDLRFSLAVDREAIERSVREVTSLLRGLLPDAEIEHVGATAVPGCLTKGDLDILVRVPPDAFAAAAATLDRALVRSSRNDATGDYAEYDLGLSDGTPASVQLVEAGSWHDHRFSGLKQELLADPDLVARYSELKLAHAGGSMEEYRQAKSEFIDSILGA